jgi:hypothetical protein
MGISVEKLALRTGLAMKAGTFLTLRRTAQYRRLPIKNKKALLIG